MMNLRIYIFNGGDFMKRSVKTRTQYVLVGSDYS